MDHLHAYWRMDYVEAPKYPDDRNPFASLPKLGDDRAAFIVYRSVFTYLILNRFPYNPGHLLVVPFRDVNDLEKLTPEERADLMDTLIFGQQLLTAALKPNGFNLGFNVGSAAGSSIPHLHGHIVPRWAGDTNFMPVLAQTRVLPQSLETMWTRLTETVERLKPKA